WAPRARELSLRIGGHDRALDDAGHGVFEALVEALPGADYTYVVDGVEMPDPCSRWQPDGLRGPSGLLDPGAFEWTDDSWEPPELTDLVLYELHVGTFTPEGTFDGAIGQLDRLARLGVTTIELMPVNAFPGRRNWGYDGVFPSAVQESYGGPEALARFVDAAHVRGLAVVLDVVYNHLGPAGNFLDEFGPYFVDLHPTNWGPGLNVDGPGSDEVRAWVVDNARMWLRDYHLDGLRLDAVHAIVDESALHVLEQLSAAVADMAAEQGRPLWLIAESDLNAPRFVRPPAEGGYGLHAAWADEWHHALHATLTGERDGYYEDFGPLHLLGKALRQAWVYDGTYSPHRQRTHGRPPTGLHGGRFVVSTQNHDQVGNRARGERLGHLVSPDRVRIAAALLLTSPFVPLLFQGEEWSASTPFQYFTDHAPELGRAVSEGRRHEFAAFGWEAGEVPDPQDPATFARSVLRWDEVTEPGHAEILDWYRELIALRRSRPGLAAAPLDDVEVEVDEDADRVVVRRRAAGVEVVVDLAAGDVAIRT
ncbi:MAG: malto-oligosyltrehalose trehalohydrolase, partial [Nocardioides sp.]